MAIRFRQSGTSLSLLGQTQWAPQLGGHNPNPPITLENPGQFFGSLQAVRSVVAGAVTVTVPFAVTSLANANNATDADNPSVTTGSFTPADGCLLVVTALTQANGGTITISISDSVGLTWTSRASSPASNFNMASRQWTAPVTTGQSMTVTISTTNGFGAASVAVAQVTGYDTTTPTGVNLAANTGSRSGSYSPALSGTSASTSAVIAGGVTDVGTATKGSSWTDLYDAQAAAGATTHEVNVEYIIGAVSAANWAALDSSFSTSAVAIEINAAPSGTTFSGTLTSPVSTMAGDLSVIVGLSGTLAAPASTIAGVLSVIGEFSGTLASAAATIAAEVSVIVALNGTLASQASAIAGAFDVSDGASFSGTLNAAASTMAGTLSVIAEFNGALASATATLAGDLSVIVELSGSLLVASASLAANLSVIVELAGVLQSAGATMAGAFDVISGVFFSGELAANVATLSGALSVIGGFSGSLQAQAPVLAGNLSVRADFSGALLMQTAYFTSSELSVIVSLSGNLQSPVATIAGECVSGLFSGNLLAQPASVAGLVDPIVAISGALWSQPAFLTLEWRVVFPNQGSGWRPIKRGHRWRMSLPRSRR